MKTTAIIVLLALQLCTSLIYGQTAVLNINDGVAPNDDGETQAGKMVSITCDVSGHGIQHSTEIQFSDDDGQNWETVYSGIQVAPEWDTDNYVVKTDIVGTTETRTLTINAVALRDEGMYKCRAVMKTDSSEIAADTKEIKTYAITQEVTIDDVDGGKYKVTAGKSKEVVCRAVNGSLPDMKLKVGTEVILDNMNVQGEADGTLYVGRGSVTFTSDQDGQQLTCEAHVQTYDQPIESSYATLQITARPEITCDPQTQPLVMNKLAVFTCTITGKPLPAINNVHWSAETNGFRLTGNQEKPDWGMDSEVTEVNGNLQAKLSVTAMEINSPDKFFITAENDGGAGEFKVELTAPGDTDQVGDGDGDGGGSSEITSYGFTFLLMIATFLRLL